MDAIILVVDDEADLLELLKMNLGRAGYIVRTARSAAETLSSIHIERPDLILLDIMLGDMSGIKLTGKLKNTPATAGIPIILLTARDSETDVLVGFNMGADDYVTKPFSTSVLVARIEAVLRRQFPGPGEPRRILSAGAIKIIPDSRQVLAAGVQIELTGGEYGILLALIEAGGSVLSRARLKAVLGEGMRGEKERIVDVHIAALRKKLGNCRRLVKTVHGHGYRIDV